MTRPLADPDGRPATECPDCCGLGHFGADECLLCAGYGTVHPDLRAKVLQVRSERAASAERSRALREDLEFGGEP